MQIGFDAKRLFLNQTGLGNYSRFIVDSLSRYYPENSYYLFTPKTKDSPQTTHYFEQGNIRIVEAKGIWKLPLLNAFWRSFLIGKTKEIQQVSIYHGLSHELPKGLPQHVKKILTVHDVIFLRNPELFNPIDVWIYRQKLKSACKMADKIVAISEQTKSDIIHFFKVDAGKIEVIYQGCHEQFLEKKSERELQYVQEKYNLPERYLLNVGSIEKRKNTGILLEALALMEPKERPHLVLVGKKTNYDKELQEIIQKHQLHEFIHFIHKANFSDLPAIYQQATAFTYSSFIEGFGIPILEAMVSNIPVLVPNVSCFDEVVGPDGLFFEQGNVKDLAEKIKLLLTTDNRVRIENQAIYAKRFFEDSIIKLMEEVYLK